VSLDATFTVRKIASGVGVERTYLLHSPNITKVEFKRSSNVRRSKLFYLRALTGKALKMKDREVTKAKWDELLASEDTAQTEATEADVAEAVEAQKQADEAMASSESTEGETMEPVEEASAEAEDKPEVNDEPAEVATETETETTEEAPVEADAGDGTDSASSGN